jgi:predicted transcriptional regulator
LSKLFLNLLPYKIPIKGIVFVGFMVKKHQKGIKQGNFLDVVRPELVSSSGALFDIKTKGKKKRFNKSKSPISQNNRFSSKLPFSKEAETMKHDKLCLPVNAYTKRNSADLVKHCFTGPHRAQARLSTLKSTEFFRTGSNFSSLPIMKASVKHLPTKRSRFKIVVRKVERPFKDDFEHQLTWICSSLGFFEPIDKDKNAAAVFKEIVLATENGEALSSTALAERVGMSRGAVINHLNNLLRSGLIEKNGKYYSARSRSMKRTIEEIEEDVERIFSQLKKAATEIDQQIGIEEEN